MGRVRQILNLQILAALLLHWLTTTTDSDTNYFIIFFAAIADVYRNEGNEASKNGDFINAIHFYTKGIKVNCNEKELKAKLYNNRAIIHFKLGKMMKTSICIFPLLKLRAVRSSFLKKVIILNVHQERNSQEKYICLVLASQTYKEVTPSPLPKINVRVVGLLYVHLIRDIYFKNRKSPEFTKGCRSSHWVKSNFPWGNCKRLDMLAVQ